MEWNTLLLIAIAYSCGSTIWRWIRRRSSPRGWAAVAGFVLILTGAACIAWPDQAGFIGGTIWGVLIILPLTLLNLSHRATLAGREAVARWLGFAAFILHPTDGLPEEYAVARATRLASRGDRAGAIAILENIAGGGSRMRAIAQLQILRLQGRWSEIAEWFSISADDAALAAEPAMVPTICRSFGETGELRALVNIYDQVRANLSGRSGQRIVNLCRLYLYSFAGMRDSLSQLLEDSFRRLPEHVKQYWLATADQAAGRIEESNAVFLAMASSASSSVSDAARQRLEHPVARAAELFTESEQKTLDYASVNIDVPASNPPWATYALIAANIVIFAVEYFAGGTRNEQVLDHLGALDLDSMKRHEWWRLIAANFLHFGWDHILMNMIGLLILGPFVEFSLGLLRYLVLYMATGIGAMLAVMILQSRGWIELDSVVGASGAIMGLVGATAALLLRDWLRFRAHDVRRRLLNVLWIVLLQVALDTFSPHVSSSAHLGGVIIGFLMGLALKYWSEGNPDQVPRVLP